MRARRGEFLAPSLDQIDAITDDSGVHPDVWIDPPRVDTPERRLLLAILEEALQQVDCGCRDLESLGALRRRGGNSHVAYDEKTLSDVLFWILFSSYRAQDDPGWGLMDVCEALDIDREYLLALISTRLKTAVSRAEAIRADGGMVVGLRSRRKRMRPRS